MNKKLFSEKEQRILLKNPYVQSISLKAITYTEEFKQLFIGEYGKGKLPREIFTQCGFDIHLVGIQRVESCAKRWLGAYKKKGVLGLQDGRKNHSGRARTRSLSLEEKYARLEAQNTLLKAENELLKKMKMMERRAKRSR
ncbi:HTH domain-containing protein [Mechercharimyces sp. CAU 1602]|uniref:HTH domain-containing protein n=1 Tax=Mechercharimyces sp. CAU 1602 TaxID=2973933 RepID=UPI002867CAA9|nr:HTH domain-containing protein [Mechercharimyces sp. CAU 1602]